MGVLTAHMSVGPPCAWCLQREAEGVKLHGIGVTDFSKWPWVLGIEPGSLVLLNTVSYLHSFFDLSLKL